MSDVITEDVMRYYRCREANRRRYKSYNPDLEWAQSVYDRVVAFPDTGIYILYFDEYGASGIGLSRSAYKIGLSDRISKRLCTLQTGTPIQLKPIHIIETNNLDWCETWLHNALRSRRIRNEQEWFALSIDDIKILSFIDLLDKPRTPEEQRAILGLFEQFNPSDSRQESMF